MSHTVIGFFKHENDAQKAIQRLEEMGISNDQVDVSRGTGTLESTSASSETRHGNSDRDNDNAITRFFKNLFGDDNDDADRYATIGNKGYSIVTVHASTASDAERAADVLDDAGAADVDATYRQYSSDRQYTGDRQQASDDRETEREVIIPKIQEELQIGKRTVESGGVRVKSRIVERPVEENIRLREERVRVDRQAVNRPISDADDAAFQDQDMEFTERAEVPVVNKEARVVEEVKISKDVSERTESIRDTVRNTEVDIDESNRGDVSRDQRNRGNVQSDNADRSDLLNDDDDDTVNLR